jgi:preprotein translocase subunit YajC
MRLLSYTVAFAQGGFPEALVQLFPLLIIFAIFYFLLIAPARKRQKALQSMIDSLTRGDQVVTTGGLYGEVVSVKDGDLVLEIAENVKVRVARSAIAGKAGEGTAEGGGK